jgi:hypothetical protein
MQQEKSLLVRHLDLLLSADPFFATMWASLSASERERFSALATAVDQIGHDWDTILQKHLASGDRLRRFLSSVPQRDMEYDRRPKDWMEFITDEGAKSELFARSEQRLIQFLGYRVATGAVRLYGGVKPAESLDRKLGEIKEGSRARRSFRDTWDVVRFRIVVGNLSLLRSVCMEIWQFFLDDIVRCRNYYMRLKNEINRDCYRAIHFELEIEQGRWIEVQAISEARDMIGYMDHAVLFKKRINQLDTDHADWIRSMGYKVNIFDELSIPLEAVKMPALGDW